MLHEICCSHGTKECLLSYLKIKFKLATTAASRQFQSDGSLHQRHQQSYLQKKIQMTDYFVYLPTLLVQLVCHL
uniref:Uncharacterized protein n=1 Tax=Arundo donax TaxID=35708 RepID=A0A0A9E737_ARUDO